VINPGHVPFIEGKDPQYYISSAGGFTESARTGDIRIIKAATKQWLVPSQTTIEESDYVWVPKEVVRPFAYYLQFYSQVFGIVSTVATLAVLVYQVTR
jgi:protein involved in polysaccharide export with SLBB domain